MSLGDEQCLWTIAEAMRVETFKATGEAHVDGSRESAILFAVRFAAAVVQIMDAQGSDAATFKDRVEDAAAEISAEVIEEEAERIRLLRMGNKLADGIHRVLPPEDLTMLDRACGAP
jgi:hypothetical protein